MRAKYIVSRNGVIVGLRYDCVNKILELGGSRKNVLAMKSLLVTMGVRANHPHCMVKQVKHKQSHRMRVTAKPVSEVSWAFGLDCLRLDGWMLKEVISFRRLMS